MRFKRRGRAVARSEWRLIAATHNLPDDPEFRSAFVAYAEWGTRFAMHNSQPDAEVGLGRGAPFESYARTGIEHGRERSDQPPTGPET